MSPTSTNGGQAWCDGACEPNPGGTGGWGFVIDLPEGGEVSGYGLMKARPDLSNNVLEYAAVGACIKRWLDLGRMSTLHIHTDSKLVVEQMLGRWKVNSGAYIPVYERLKNELLPRCPFIVTWCWVPRERNTRADKLSKRALIEAGITPTVRR